MSISFVSVTKGLITHNSNWMNMHTVELPAGQTASIEAGVFCRRDGNDDCAKWQLSALFRRDGSGPVELVSSVVNLISPIKTLGAALWDFRIRVDSDAYVYFDAKGGSMADVGWFLWGDVRVMVYPP